MSRIHSAYLRIAGVWIACVGCLFVLDSQNALLGIATGAYALLLGAVCHWLLPKGGVDSEGTLRANGTPRSVAIRSGIAATAVAWTILSGVAWGGLSGGPGVPWLTPFMATLGTHRTPFHDSRCRSLIS